MSLRLIYGRSGSGKSSFIYDEIESKIKQNSKIYIITPEQFSFTAEKKLMEHANGAVINAEVLTFNRMAYRVLKETGGNIKQDLSKCGKAMLIYDILTKNKKNLKFLGKSDENIDIVGTQITEFKKHGITVETLENTKNEMQDKYLKCKTEDMLLVYNEFQKVISDRFIDETDRLTYLSEKIEEVCDFENTIIYIDEFVGFTKQEYEIIRKLLKTSKSVSVTVCADDLELNKLPDTDIFYSNKVTAKKILDLAKDENIKIEKSIKVENKNNRFKTPELKFIEENLYSIPQKKYDEKIDNLNLFLANNQYSEIEYIASEIVKLVRNKGYRYKDISIISKNLDTYSNLCKAIFHEYDIPIFIDEKKDLNNNILIQYILSILEVFAKNWSHEAVFNYIKIGFTDIDELDIYDLENFCLKWGIKQSKWYKSDWKFGDDSKENIDYLKRMNELRHSIVDPLLELKNELNKDRNVQEITKVLYEFLIKYEIDIKIQNKVKDLTENNLHEIAIQYKNSWKLLISIFDEIVLIFGDKKITFEQYKQILKVGFKNSGLGIIPATQDQVIMGDVDRSKSHKVKAIFIIGLNDGIFPSVNRNEGFFDDKDRNYFKEKGIELANGTLENLYEENFNIYKAFTTAEEKLYLSYSSSDSEGKSLRPSIMIGKIKKIFTKLPQSSDILKKQLEILNENVVFEELLIELRNFNEGKEIKPECIFLFNYFKQKENWKAKLENALEGIEYSNSPQNNIDKKTIDKLYGKVLRSSVSRFEQYRACPFSYYLKYGLKISETKKLQVNSIDTGSFMHEVIDEFCSQINEKEINIKHIEEEQTNVILKEIIDEKLKNTKNYIFSSTPKYRLLAQRLKRVVIKSMKYIIESLKCSNFDVLGNEIEFKEGKKYPPIIIPLDDGKKVEITGKIDRIDVAKFEGKNYIRIIDYKSSVKNIDLNEVYEGLQIQLLTYLDATCQNEEFLPAGVLYFNLIDPVIKASQNLSAEEIEREIRKKFKMNGLILADVDVVKGMDKTLEKGASDKIPAYLDKDGNLSKSKSNAVNATQFEFLQKYMNKIIKQIAEEILSGNIELKPYYNVKNKKTPCEYCEYKPICNFNQNGCKNSYRYIGNFDKEFVLEQIKNDLEN